MGPRRVVHDDDDDNDDDEPRGDDGQDDEDEDAQEQGQAPASHSTGRGMSGDVGGGASDDEYDNDEVTFL